MKKQNRWGLLTGTSLGYRKSNVNASKTIFRRPVVTRSISSDEGLRCVDIFRRKDNSFDLRNIEKTLKLTRVGLK